MLQALSKLWLPVMVLSLYEEVARIIVKASKRLEKELDLEDVARKEVHSGIEHTICLYNI